MSQENGFIASIQGVLEKLGLKNKKETEEMERLEKIKIEEKGAITNSQESRSVKDDIAVKENAARTEQTQTTDNRNNKNKRDDKITGQPSKSVEEPTHTINRSSFEAREETKEATVLDRDIIPKDEPTNSVPREIEQDKENTEGRRYGIIGYGAPCAMKNDTVDEWRTGTLDDSLGRVRAIEGDRAEEIGEYKGNVPAYEEEYDDPRRDARYY